MTRKTLYMHIGVLVGLVALAGPKARADVITTYNIQGNGPGGAATTQYDATIVGSFQIDQTIFNASTGAGVTVTSPITVSNDQYINLDGTYNYLGAGVNYIFFDQNGFEPNMVLFIPMNPPPQTGNISLYSSYLYYSPFQDYFDSSDYLTATTTSTGPTAAPEPSTLTILTAGVVGIVGLGRRRKRIDPGL